MFQYNLLNLPSFAIDDKRIKLIFEMIDTALNISQSGCINIAFIADDEMAKYNAQYRGKDMTTDVLSFHYHEKFESFPNDEVVGEIVMSEKRIIEQARIHNHSEREEFEILLIHGVLHILGHDHESDDEYEDMWKYESAIRTALGLSLRE